MAGRFITKNGKKFFIKPTIREKIVERNANFGLLSPGNIRGAGRRFTGAGTRDPTPRIMERIRITDDIATADQRRMIAVGIEQEKRREAEVFFQQDRVTPSQIKAVDQQNRLIRMKQLGL